MTETWEIAGANHPTIYVYAPRGKTPYFRIGWTEDGKWRVASGGKTSADAEQRALQIRDRLAANASPSINALTALLDTWLVTPHGRRPWSPKYASGNRYVLDHYVRPVIGDVPCYQLQKRHIQQAVDSAPTVGEGNRTKKVLRTALRWGYGEDWLTTDPERLVRNVYWGSGQQIVTHQGLNPDLVLASEIPSEQNVETLAWSMAHVPGARPQDALAVLLACYTGLRLGELLALEIDDIDLSGATNTIQVLRQVVEVEPDEPGGEWCRITPPKWSKTRTAVLPEVIPGGYLLAEAIEERIAEVRQETRHLPDREPRYLLTAPRGSRWVPSRWTERRFRAAARIAGWPSSPAIRDGKEIVRLDWSWHSLRHRYAHWLLWGKNPVSHADVAMLMGHADVSVTLRVYGSGGTGHLDRIGQMTSLQALEAETT